VSSNLHAQAEPLYIFLADAFSFFSAASRAASAVVSFDHIEIDERLTCGFGLSLLSGGFSSSSDFL
jgi:hypothetical protein